jgi:hypothetical protein
MMTVSPDRGLGLRYVLFYLQVLHTYLESSLQAEDSEHELLQQMANSVRKKMPSIANDSKSFLISQLYYVMKALRLDGVACAYNPSTLEAKGGESQVQGQNGLHSETLFQPKDLQETFAGNYNSTLTLAKSTVFVHLPMPRNSQFSEYTVISPTCEYTGYHF